jgi:myo-inositol-1(or 4)-monophosphatase
LKARLELAVALAREAGALQRQRFGEPRDIQTKSTAIDLVTDVDRACDALIRERVRQQFPGDGLLTEEAAEAPGSSGWRWIVDPLDGTTNYTHGFPHFAVSIGVERDGRAALGTIYDPLRDELFHGMRGAGAFRNGRPMRVSLTEKLERSLLATGFPYTVHASPESNLEYFGRFIRRARAVRRAGSAALDLAYIACGRFDGFWELSLHPWDVTAGLLMIEEAGGMHSDFDGSPTPTDASRVVASNGRVHAAMLEVLADPG